MEYDPFIKGQLASTELTLGPYAVQSSSRDTLESGTNETCVVYRVDREMGFEGSNLPEHIGKESQSKKFQAMKFTARMLNNQ